MTRCTPAVGSVWMVWSFPQTHQADGNKKAASDAGGFFGGILY
ncbi:hypothetical protein D555_2633 [Bordetella holmesii 35009]|nr:hypothetical protein D555_2633 [Bordetella holmesii 35009]